MMKNLDDLEPGESCVYYTGVTLTVVNTEEKHTAWRMYFEGKAELTQRSVKVSQTIGLKEYLVNGFEYIITRRRVDVTGRELAQRQAYFSRLEAEKMKQMAYKTA